MAGLTVMRQYREVPLEAIWDDRLARVPWRPVCDDPLAVGLGKVAWVRYVYLCAGGGKLREVPVEMRDIPDLADCAALMIEARAYPCKNQEEASHTSPMDWHCTSRTAGAMSYAARLEGCDLVALHCLAWMGKGEEAPVGLTDEMATKIMPGREVPGWKTSDRFGDGRFERAQKRFQETKMNRRRMGCVTACVYRDMQNLIDRAYYAQRKDVMAGAKAEQWPPKGEWWNE